MTHDVLFYQNSDIFGGKNIQHYVQNNIFSSLGCYCNIRFSEAFNVMILYAKYKHIYVRNWRKYSEEQNVNFEPSQCCFALAICNWKNIFIVKFLEVKQHVFLLDSKFLTNE